MLNKNKTSLGIRLFFVFWCVICVLPMWLVVSISFSQETDLIKHGFKLWPMNWTLDAYRYLFANPKTIIDAYKVTVLVSFSGTFLMLLVNSLAGYSFTRLRSRYKSALVWFIYFPSLFSGGLAASYIVNTQILHMKDSLWILILPGLASSFTIFQIRAFMQGLPDGLFEAAQIDGASEYRIYFQIALPLSKPVLATVGYTGLIGRWNSWYEAMIYIDTPEKRPIQYLLQQILGQLQALLDQMDRVPGSVNLNDLPGENLRMAMLVLAVGPAMLFLPFFQKYFAKGAVIGSVKG